MEITRRGLVVAAGLAALAQIAAAAARKLQPAVGAAAPALRPDARGTSGGVCARCGAGDHRTLDARCPAGREALVARQATARDHAGRRVVAGA